MNSRTESKSCVISSEVYLHGPLHSTRLNEEYMLGWSTTESRTRTVDDQSVLCWIIVPQRWQYFHASSASTYQMIIYVPGETVYYSGGYHDLSFIGGRRDSDSSKWKEPIANSCCWKWPEWNAERSWQECLGQWVWDGASLAIIKLLQGQQHAMMEQQQEQQRTMLEQQRAQQEFMQSFIDQQKHTQFCPVMSLEITRRWEQPSCKGMHEVNEETHWIWFQQERSVVTSHTMSFFQPVAESSTECLRNCPSCLLELVSLRKSSQTKEITLCQAC